MKKIIIAAVCAFCALTASAQRASSSSSSFFSTEKVDGGVQFGIRGGLNVAGMDYTEDNVTVSTDNRANWHVGIIADIPMMESLYVQTGLYLQNKGYKEKEGDNELTANPMYLEIPVLASYRYNFSDAAQLQINVGPYFAYGVGGKIKETDGDDEDKVDFFSEDGGAKNFDCGLQIGAGLTIAKNYYIGAAYEFGFTNIAKNSGDGKLKNKNWMFSVGYNF
ncbi:MAG: PorT family protein [Escherichia coli]|nr:PorT family protein [Escherichia coli]